MLIEINRKQFLISNQHHSEDFLFLSFFIFIDLRFIFRHFPDQPSVVRPSNISIVNSQRDSTPLKISHSSIDPPSENSFTNISEQTSPSHSSTLCPLCQIPFDSTGFHRPVSDACGHTTCFQCFKVIMIKATGCTLCQKEEENNSVSIQ